MFQQIRRFRPWSAVRAAALAITLLATATLPAQAALPRGTLSYVQPSGVVSSTDVIDIRVVLTLNADSSPLTFSSNPLTGFDQDDLPTVGSFYNPATGQIEQRPFAEISSAYLTTFYVCTGTFTNSCDPSPNYRFEFWISSTPGNPSLVFRDSFALAPGESFEYLFGQFVPAATGAAPGSYLWHSTGLQLVFQGTDADGNALYAERGIAQSCPSLDDACAFTRMVVEVPEPSTWGLMALGLLAMGGWARRRG